MTGDSFAWVRGVGGYWPGGAQDIHAHALADYRCLENELPHFTVRRTGSLAWAGAPAQDSRPGPGQFRIGRSDIAALEPNLRHPPDQAIYTPSDAGIDPTAMTHALTAAAGAHGATVLHNTAVTSLQVTNGRVEGVLTSTGLHAATTVVLAAGQGSPSSASRSRPTWPLPLPRPPSRGSQHRLAWSRPSWPALISRSERYGTASSCWSCRMLKAQQRWRSPLKARSST